MYIKHLDLKHYRNYQHEALSFENKVNVILGENAQGKTNLIEAIFVLAMAKSHRTNKDKELIYWDQEFAKISGEIIKRNHPISLEVVVSAKGKKVKLNGLEQRKLSEYIGAANVVMFAPEDLGLVKGSPQVRRRFMDMEIGQTNPVYLHYLSKYQKILQQRNHLLKDYDRNKQAKLMLDVLTTQLVEMAVHIMDKRIEFVRLLQDWASRIHFEISRGKEQLQIHYNPSLRVSDGRNLSKIEENLYLAFEKGHEQELRRRMTLFGPHRDDLSFSLNGKDVQTFGSQGQQRTTALSLKLAEIELIHDKIGDYPILLLDDVLSELDDHRQSHLLHAISGKVQTFVTTTNTSGINHETLNHAATFNVCNGSISQLK